MSITNNTNGLVITAPDSTSNTWALELTLLYVRGLQGRLVLARRSLP